MANTNIPDSMEAGFNTAGSMISQGKTVQQVQTKYQTAVSIQKERDLDRVRDKCLAEARIAGEEFFYHWEVPNKKTRKKEIIEGPSIHCAIAAARNYGNCAVESAGVEVTDKEFIFHAAFIDIETGFTMTRPFRMDRNFTVYGKMDEFRKDDIRFQIGASKAIRNVVQVAMPRGLINQMLEAAKGSVRSKIEAKIASAEGDIDKVIEKMLSEFGKFGVDQPKIEDKLGLKREYWDVDTLVMLSGDYKALRDGSETAESLFGEPSQQTNGERAAAAAGQGDPSKHQGHDEKPKKQPEQPQQPPEESGPPPEDKNEQPATGNRPAATSDKPAPEPTEKKKTEDGQSDGDSGKSVDDNDDDANREIVAARLKHLLGKHEIPNNKVERIMRNAIDDRSYNAQSLREFCQTVESYPLKKEEPAKQETMGDEF